MISLLSLVAGCTAPAEPWEPPQESAEAQQAWEKAQLQNLKPGWLFLEGQFVEWGMLPPEPSKPLLGGDDFNAGQRPRPQQTPLQEEESEDKPPPEEESQLHRRQLFLYASKPVDRGRWSQFRIGWLARSGEQWSRQLELKPPMRVRCEAGKASAIEILEAGQYKSLAINGGLDGSTNGTANLQQLIPELGGWICRQRQASDAEALKPLVVER